jgi:hypothetical protein
VGGWSRHACRVSPTKCGTESSRYVNATDTSADFRDAPIQPGVPSVPRCAVNPGRKLSGRRRRACVLASVHRPNCPYTFRVILGFCGCNLRPSCFRIRRAASTAARASAADLQLVAQSSAKLVSWYPLSRPLRWLPALSLARRSTRFGLSCSSQNDQLRLSSQPGARALAALVCAQPAHCALRRPGVCYRRVDIPTRISRLPPGGGARRHHYGAAGRITGPMLTHPAARAGRTTHGRIVHAKPS